MTNPNELWQVGQTIADLYEVRGVNTEGGMSIVYFVWHKTWNTELVIKTPRPQLMKDQRSRDDFTREAETWVKLGMHPNIVTAFYVRQIDDFPRIIVEKMNGGSLKEWLARGKVPDLATALDIAIQVAGGLAYAQKHQPDFVHRDLKPANVLMTPGGLAKVTDFGLAGVIGKQVGTPAYMAPEVWQEAATITPAADWYSFGVVLFELLTGRRPFDRGDKGVSLGQIQGGKGVEDSVGALRAPVMAPELSQRSLGEKLDIQRVSDRSLGEVSMSSMDVTDADMAFYRDAHLNQAPRSPRELNSNIPEELNALCLELLVKDEEKRLADTAGIIQRLKTIYENSVGTAYPRPEPKEVDLVADSMNNYALSMLDLGKPEEAEKYWEEALKKHPGHLECTYNQGLQQWRNAKINDDELVRRLRGVGQVTEPWRVAVVLSQVHLEQGDCEEAIRLLDSLNKVDHTRSDVANLLDFAKINQSCTRKIVRTFEGHTSMVRAVCFSPDGRTALSGSNDKTLKLWEVETGQCVRTFEGHTQWIQSVSFSPDGRYALSGSNDKTLKLWEMKTGLCVRTFEGHKYSVDTVCFSPDGRYALSGGIDHTLELWEIETDRYMWIFKGHADNVRSVCFNADGQYALSGSKDKMLKLWDVGSRRCLRTFEGHTDEVNSVCFSPDGQYALSGSKDKTLKLWEMKTGLCVRTFEGHIDEVSSVCFSPDRRYVSSGSWDHKLKLWGLASGRCTRTFDGHILAVQSVCFSPDGRHALSGSWDNTLKLWGTGIVWDYSAPWELTKPASGAEIGEQEDAFRVNLERSDQANNSDILRHLQEVRSLEVYKRHPELIRRWQKLSAQLPHALYTDAWSVETFDSHMWALSLDRRYALSLHMGGFVLWAVESKEKLRMLAGSSPDEACFSPDARYAITVGGVYDAYLMKLWDVESGFCVRTFTGHGVRVMSIRFSPDGRYALTGSVDKTVKLWEVETGRCLRTFEGHTERVESVCFSPDGRTSLSGSWDKTVKLWEVKTGLCVRTFEGHASIVLAVCFSPDGRTALSGSHDKTLKLWDVETGLCLRSFEGHTEVVFSVCFSPDGRYALSGSRDHTAKLWNLETGLCARTFEGHAGDVVLVAFSPDGTSCYTSSGDKTIQWYLDWELEYKEPADGDEGARLYLRNFLALHTPYAGTLPVGRDPTEDEVRLALTKCGRPVWTEEDFQGLMKQLGPAGYSWLRPEGVRKELEAMVDTMARKE